MNCFSSAVSLLCYSDTIFITIKLCRNMLKVCRASITLGDYGEHLISFTLSSPGKDFLHQPNLFPQNTFLYAANILTVVREDNESVCWDCLGLAGIANAFPGYHRSYSSFWQQIICNHRFLHCTMQKYRLFGWK